MEAISAAHPTMPMPSYARVTNLASGKSLIVRVNDRGPYHANREIDVSSKAAGLLGFKGHGIARVRVDCGVVGRGASRGSRAVRARVDGVGLVGCVLALSAGKRTRTRLGSVTPVLLRS